MSRSPWRWVERGLGTAILIGAGVALPSGLLWSSHDEDLHVDVGKHRAFGIADEEARHVGPAEILPRVQHTTRGEDGPGVELQTWKLTYGGRWDREVTWPALRGPFHAPWSEWPCALGLVLRPEMFDDGTPGGDDLASVIDAEIRRAFPIGLDRRVPKVVRDAVELPNVHDTKVVVTLGDGYLDARADIVFVDGATVAVDARLKLERRPLSDEPNEEDPGDLEAVVVRARLLQWTGPTRSGVFQQIIGKVARRVGKGIAQQYVRDHVVKTLAPLRLPTPRAVLPGRAGDRLGVALCADPEIRPDGVRLPLRISAELSPERDPTIPGPVRIGGALRWPEEANGSRLQVVFSPEGLSQLVYLAWQSGLLSEWAEDPDLLDSFEAKAADRLAFELTGLDLDLPPTFLPGNDDGWRLRVAQVGLGPMDDRQVVAHADMHLTALGTTDVIGFRGRVERVWMNCAELRAKKGFRLSPCLSDVLPILRDSDELREPVEMTLDPRLLKRLTTTSFAGYDIRLSEVRATGPDGHGQMVVEADARIVDPKAKPRKRKRD